VLMMLRTAIAATTKPTFHAELNLVANEHCAKLVVEAELAMRDPTWLHWAKKELDSVDDVPEQQLDLCVDKRQADLWVWPSCSPKLTELAAPLIRQVIAALHRFSPETSNMLQGAFIRKYEKGSLRDGLAIHADGGLHTANVLLNSGYDGGDLVFVNPQYRPQVGAPRRLHNGSKMTKIRRAFLDNMANLDQRQAKWFKKFVDLDKDDADAMADAQLYMAAPSPGLLIIHDDKVPHFITKMSSGVKYSLIMFFDQEESSPIFQDPSEGVVEADDPDAIWAPAWDPDLEDL